ncbi:alkyl/aryl-sulfatase [Pseudidiomarina taiwanensis]|uniref:Alkyl/aryl-sulfatase n=1 Tax=Pseudidiomarina taiwanensis TaxID=337250 RepID=A0A432ZK53_9GAMM|nr:alkyl sulfatase dimerization domain-containing protein [Pseudidiomarina taiwanensis]RUO78319.1 alkyl/aryl-sulfatase [Pseudidiomarina taiwanensis]
MKIINRIFYLLYCCALAGLLSGCSDSLDYEADANAAGHTAATPATIKANQALLAQRPFADRSDFTLARKGLLAQESDLRIFDKQGSVIWDMNAYDFIDAEGENAPASVNPSLWRQAALNNIHGLFEVTSGVYQLRGYDLANMTIIEGETGWIIVDPLTVTETASRAFLFAQAQLGKQPVKAIIFTHSHIDHFGGVEGILQHLSAQELAELRVIAPAGFDHEATSENIIAGAAMGRRAGYMYGKELMVDPRAHIGNGLGKQPAFGSFSYQRPTELIDEHNTEQTIAGVPFIFQLVSGSEAPSEFTFYLPEHKAFCGAELVSRNLHNLYTLRGAKVRDALLWSRYIDEARQRFSAAEVYFASHHWPLWGQAQINEFLEQQRDTYKFIHDQTVRMINHGYTANEIANTIELPETLMQAFHNQGYYGTIQHNAKAVYQFYLGWYNANPAQLHPLPETDVAKRYIEMMGGIDAVVIAATAQFEQANQTDVNAANATYRWLAELLNHAVYADPSHAPAKALLAKVYDQLGYQAEAAPWRGVYLSAANELRNGKPSVGIEPRAMKDILLDTDVENFFTSMAVRLNAEKAADEELRIKVSLTDLNEHYLLTVKNSVLHHRQVDADTLADAEIAVTLPLLVDILVGDAGVSDTLFSEELEITGSELDVLTFLGLLDKPDGLFNIVTP